MNSIAFGVGVLVLLFEFQNVLSWSRRRLLPSDAPPSEDFTIVVPLYGDPSYFATGRPSLERYRANTLVAIETTPPAMQAYADELEADGFQVCRIAQGAPNPASLVARALEALTTTAVVRLDADTIVGSDLPTAVGGLLQSGADLASVKVEAANRRTIVAKLQHLEYRIAMLSRHYRPWLTSGACIVGRTDALRRIFASHSHWTPGEDIETGRTALALGMRVRHADMTVWTAVPERASALYRQRALWWAGNFRHAIVNVDRNALHMPVMTAYWLLLLWSSLWYRPWGMLDWAAIPQTLPFLYVGYLLITVVSNLKVASPWMLVFPLYAVLQSLLMPSAGVWMYVRVARRRRSLGRYRFGYRRERPCREPEVSPALS